MQARPQPTERDLSVSPVKSCAYCGSCDNLEREHVIPRCLFIKQPDDHVIVPACPSCNREKSRYDSELRDFVAVDYYSSKHPTARKLIESKIGRSVRSNRGQLSRTIHQARLETILSNGGIALFRALTMPIDGVPIQKALEFIVRGLYFHTQGVQLPPETNFEIHRYMHDAYTDLRAMLDSLQGNGTGKVGDVFYTRYTYASDVAHAGVFAMQFHGTVFAVYFGSAEDMADEAP